MTGCLASGSSQGNRLHGTWGLAAAGGLCQEVAQRAPAARGTGRRSPATGARSGRTFWPFVITWATSPRTSSSTSVGRAERDEGRPNARPHRRASSREKSALRPGGAVPLIGPLASALSRASRKMPDDVVDVDPAHPLPAACRA